MGRADYCRQPPLRMDCKLSQLRRGLHSSDHQLGRLESEAARREMHFDGAPPAR